MLGLKSHKGSRELEMPNTCLANPNPNNLSGNLSHRSHGFEKFAHHLFLRHSVLLKGPKNVLFIPHCHCLGKSITFG